MKKEITIHSSAAEYLTFVAAAGESAESLKSGIRMKISG